MDCWAVVAGWDVRSEEEHSNSNSEEDSEVNVIIHYDSGDESTITPSSSDTSSHEDTPVVQYRRSASSESGISEDSLNMVVEIYESNGYIMKRIVGRMVYHSVVRSTVSM